MIASATGSRSSHKPSLISKAPYQGSQRKLAIAFDVGTTFSGVSYTVLDPGEIPKVLTITRFPAQGSVGSDSKIPTVVYYDKHGVMRAAGAEAFIDDKVELALEEEWTKVEWFKLHLRPKTLPSSHITDADLPPLPPNKTGADILADVYRYLLKCTREFIEDSHGTTGRDLWASAFSRGNIDYVLTHPNGWEGAEKAVIRKAAVVAGLVPGTPAGQARVQVLSEGEASLHFCVHNEVVDDAVGDGQGALVVDAGGGTIDLSSYALRRDPDSFVEIAPPECLLQGSVLVSRRAKEHLYKKLKGSRYGHPEDIEVMVSNFDTSAKVKFRDSNEYGYIRFGSARDRDPSFGINNGQLKLTGAEMEELFEPAIRETTLAIRQQIKAASKPIGTIFLVGGFAASDWLFSRLQASLQSTNITFFRPDRHVNKAVPNGAISFYLNHLVSARVSKWTCGAESFPLFNASNLDHRKRESKTFSWPSGRSFVPGRFEVLLVRGTQIAEVQEYRKTFFREISDLNQFETFSKNVLCYKGSKHPVPDWMDTDPDMFTVLCRVEADMKKMARSVKPVKQAGGETFYKFNFQLVLLFGQTELKAYLSWFEGSSEIRGPATIVYDDV